MSNGKSGGGSVKSRLPIFVTSTAAFLLFCVVPSDNPEQQFHFLLADCCDTVAPFGELRIAFSEPLSDSSQPEFIFNPPFFSFSVEMNAFRDTALLNFSEPLAGVTEYQVRLGKTVRSLHNSVFRPEDDTLQFVTIAREQEPNDRRDIADTLQGAVYGAIAMVNDTDWYVITSAVKKVYCISSGSRTGFLPGGPEAWKEPREFAENDTVVISDTASLPLYIAVHSYLKSVGGYYKIGCLPKRP
jgi:hypothetical protein